MVPTELGRRLERSVRAAASRRVAVALELHVSSRLRGRRSSEESEQGSHFCF